MKRFRPYGSEPRETALPRLRESARRVRHAPYRARGPPFSEPPNGTAVPEPPSRLTGPAGSRAIGIATPLPIRRDRGSGPAVPKYGSEHGARRGRYRRRSAPAVGLTLGGEHARPAGAAAAHVGAEEAELGERQQGARQPRRVR